jgi:hypothetical protein
MVKTNKLTILALAAVMGLAVPAFAGPLPEKGPNGGIVGEAGEHHIELVVSGQALTVHLLDQKNKPVAETGLTGTAVVTAGGMSETVNLTDQGGGKLGGTGKFSATAALQMVVTINAPAEPTMTVKFDVKR